MKEMSAQQVLIEDQTNAIFKALSSKSRRQILAVLRDGEQCVCHIEAFTGFRQAYISQQLKVLRDAGLIADRRSGWNIFYRVVESEIFTILDDIARLTGQSLETFRKSKTVCTCPKCSKNFNN